MFVEDNSYYKMLTSDKFIEHLNYLIKRANNINEIYVLKFIDIEKSETKIIYLSSITASEYLKFTTLLFDSIYDNDFMLCVIETTYPDCSRHSTVYCVK